MTDKAGLWIDHRKAVVVLLGTEGERIVHVESHVESQLRRAGGSPLTGAYEARQVPPDDRRQMALTGELNAYYDAVIAAVAGAESLLVLGPGEAKGELKARLEHRRLGERIADVQSSDKLTDRQIAAKVRQFFGAAAAAGA